MTRTFQAPGLVLTEHEFSVPLDHSDPDGVKIDVFVREVSDPEGRDRPFLVFFQGGPGSEAPRPDGPPSGWLSRALQDFRVLLLDQRGTGRSTPIGTLEGLTPTQQVGYLTHFRADSIVRDAELIRSALGVETWSVLGQSFGGFCAMAYLSFARESLREVLITGGLAPIAVGTDEVYRRTYERVRAANNAYFHRYPTDRDRVRAIRERLEASNVRLPSGDRLTWRRFKQLGIMLGMSGGAERLHYIVELPPDAPAFLHDVERATAFGRNPLYAIIHEACYADGCRTGWSAERVIPPDLREEEMFTGEHVYPWMFDEYGLLSPLRDAANLLADHEWPALYDAAALRDNDVPVAAAVYLEDMYVDYNLSMQTAEVIRGLRPWVTNEYQHNGLRVNGESILSRLLDLTRGRA